jgi:hypothetical protein
LDVAVCDDAVVEVEIAAGLLWLIIYGDSAVAHPCRLFVNQRTFGWEYCSIAPSGASKKLSNGFFVSFPYHRIGPFQLNPDSHPALLKAL